MPGFPTGVENMGRIEPMGDLSKFDGGRLKSVLKNTCEGVKVASYKHANLQI